MNITDELREYATNDSLHYCSDYLAIADRIDAEHEQQMRERKGCIHYDQERHYCNVHDLTTEDYKRGYDDGFASADDWLAQHEDAMTEHGWIRLPKDADGEYIHVGDVMDKGNVTCIRDCGKGWEIVLNSLYTYDAPSLHHHAPTVEDVLREFADPGTRNVVFDYPLIREVDGDFMDDAPEQGTAEAARRKGGESNRRRNDHRWGSIDEALGRAVNQCYLDGVPATRRNVAERATIDGKPVTNDNIKRWTRNDASTKWRVVQDGRDWVLQCSDESWSSSEPENA